MHRVVKLAKVTFALLKEHKNFSSDVKDTDPITGVFPFLWHSEMAKQHKVTDCIIQWLCCLGYIKLLNRTALCSNAMNSKAHNCSKTVDKALSLCIPYVTLYKVCSVRGIF